MAYRSLTPIGIPHNSGAASPSRRRPLVGRARVLAGALGIQARPGVDRVGRAVVRRRPAVALLDSRQARFGQLDRRQLAGAQVPVSFEHPQVGGVGELRPSVRVRDVPNCSQSVRDSVTRG